MDDYIISANHYLDVRRSNWAIYEERGMVRAAPPFVLVVPLVSPIMLEVWRRFPGAYPAKPVAEHLGVALIGSTPRHHAPLCRGCSDTDAHEEGSPWGQ